MEARKIARNKANGAKHLNEVNVSARLAPAPRRWDWRIFQQWNAHWLRENAAKRSIEWNLIVILIANPAPVFGIADQENCTT